MINIDPTEIRFIGRYTKTTINDEEMIMFANSCSGFELGINVVSNENELFLKLYGNTNSGYSEQFFNVYIDDVFVEKYSIANKVKTIKIFENLQIGNHKVKVIKLNEAQFSKMGLVSIDSSGIEFYKTEFHKKKIEFYGDSISCGFGNLSNTFETSELLEYTDGTKAYTQICADELGFENSVIGYSGIGLAISPNNQEKYLLDVYDTVDGDIKWDFEKYVPDVIVINIGTNDTAAYNALSNNQQKDEVYESYLTKYKELVLTLKEEFPNVKIVAVADMMIKFSDAFKTAIDAIKNYVHDSYQEFMYYVEFAPNTDGGVGHPSQQAHQEFGLQLANFISKIM